jgi:DivIVA domain-containing protein
MITPQSIREKTFEKAVSGGYDMSSVETIFWRMLLPISPPCRKKWPYSRAR